MNLQRIIYPFRVDKNKIPFPKPFLRVFGRVYDFATYNIPLKGFLFYAFFLQCRAICFCRIPIFSDFSIVIEDVDESMECLFVPIQNSLHTLHQHSYLLFHVFSFQFHLNFKINSFPFFFVYIDLERIEAILCY